MIDSDHIFSITHLTINNYEVVSWILSPVSGAPLLINQEGKDVSLRKARFDHRIHCTKFN